MRNSRNKKPNFFENIIQQNNILPVTNKQEGLAFLTSFFAEIRSTKIGANKADDCLKEATNYIKQSSIIKANMQHAVLSQLIDTHLSSAVTDSGIPLARGFWQEFANRLKHKFLPQLQNEADFLYTVNSVFYKKSDYKWVENISRQTWINFFEEVSEGFSGHSANIKAELIYSLRILSFQIAQIGLEKEVENYLPAEATTTVTTFIKQNYKVKELENLLLVDAAKQQINFTSHQLKEEIGECYKMIEYIRDKHSEKGASLQQTYLLLILTNRLERMQLVTDILDADSRFDTGRFVDLFKMLVRFEKRKNSIREFLSQGAGYLAYQIAEHKGSRGHKYITATRKDYYKMISSAMWGGVIISFIAIVKNLIGKLKFAPFPLGFLYSLNYSAGFILIDETKSTLATKQPAFTASAVAGSLDVKRHGAEPDLNNLAVTVAKISRSQIASFFGNLIIVFPLTFLLAWLFELLTNSKIADEKTAWNLLKGQHPWRSPALLYACFTGFFLFLSGIIAGYWQNKIQYSRIKERLIKHPVLKNSLSQKRLERIGGYIEKNFGALVGSLSLGFFLGFSTVLGTIIGIPFDIRHITIAAGNVSIGAYELGISNIPPYFLLTVIFGVLLIGFVNFLVSFSLAFFVAVKSRGIHLSQYPKFLGILRRYFFNNTKEFFLAPKKEKTSISKPLGN